VWDVRQFLASLSFWRNHGVFVEAPLLDSFASFLCSVSLFPSQTILANEDGAIARSRDLPRLHAPASTLGLLSQDVPSVARHSDRCHEHCNANIHLFPHAINFIFFTSVLLF
jgi:hypothetical protein